MCYISCLLAHCLLFEHLWVFFTAYYEAILNVIFSVILLFPLFKVQMFCSLTP
jgi:hypothetical protein